MEDKLDDYELDKNNVDKSGIKHAKVKRCEPSGKCTRRGCGHTMTPWDQDIQNGGTFYYTTCPWCGYTKIWNKKMVFLRDGKSNLRQLSFYPLDGQYQDWIYF